MLNCGNWNNSWIDCWKGFHINDEVPQKLARASELVESCRSQAEHFLQQREFERKKVRALAKALSHIASENVKNPKKFSEDVIAAFKKRFGEP